MWLRKAYDWWLIEEEMKNWFLSGNQSCSAETSFEKVFLFLKKHSQLKTFEQPSNIIFQKWFIWVSEFINTMNSVFVIACWVLKLLFFLFTISFWFQRLTCQTLTTKYMRRLFTEILCIIWYYPLICRYVNFLQSSDVPFPNGKDISLNNFKT